MQTITRNNYPPINKILINEEPRIYYEELDLNLINHLIQETISECVCNTIDLITLLRENYHSNLNTTIEDIKDFSQVRFNCYYASKVLKEKLIDYGIDTKFISYKSIGFSSPFGDNLIKEAHMALLLRTKKDNDDYYLILDPGYRLPEPIGFYPKKENSEIMIDNDIIEISSTTEELYPYSMNMKGYNRYSISNTSYECSEFFNANYETINPESILFPLSYKVLDGYRAIRYSENPSYRATIKIMLLEQYIECMNAKKREIFTFKEFKKFSQKESIELLSPYTDILQLSPKIISEDFYFLINNLEEFVNNVIREEVVKEKTKVKRTI